MDLSLGGVRVVRGVVGQGLLWRLGLRQLGGSCLNEKAHLRGLHVYILDFATDSPV